MVILFVLYDKVNPLYDIFLFVLYFSVFLFVFYDLVVFLHGDIICSL